MLFFSKLFQKKNPFEQQLTELTLELRRLNVNQSLNPDLRRRRVRAIAKQVAATIEVNEKTKHLMHL